MHPERVARIEAIEQELTAHGWLGWDVRASPPVERATLEAIHPGRYVDALEAFCARGGGAIDADTVCSPGSFVAALHAAGGAVALVDALLGDGPPVGASLHRPPGHHAERERAMGFCLFANVAVAAQHALDTHGAQRVMVLDWDVHHGNGTNDIFHAEPRVLFVSVHQAPLFPGTGAAADIGSGPGTGFTVNLPVPEGSGDDVWCSLVEHVAVPLLADFSPQLLLVSAGFDGHRDDPLAGCRCTEAGYATMAASVARAATALGVPVGMVLEGGYDLTALARSVRATLAALAADPLSPDPPPGVHPLSARARDGLRARWAGLAG